MQVQDVMTRVVVDVQTQTSIYDAIQLMLAQKVSSLPVVDGNGELVGVISEGDLLRRVELGTTRTEHWYSHFFTPGGSAEAYTATHTRRVGDVMSSPAVTTTPTAPLTDAVALMERRRIKRLPVVDKGRIVGIVSRADFLRALSRLLAPACKEPAVSDADIERNIVAALQAQDWAINSGIRVRVESGHVSLSGSITAESERTAAHVLAGNINGVRSVTDDLACIDAIALTRF